MSDKKVRCGNCEFCAVVKMPGDPPPPSWWTTDWFPLWECSKGHTKKRNPVYEQGRKSYRLVSALRRAKIKVCGDFASMD